MPGRKMLCLGVTFLLFAPCVSSAQHGHMHGGGGHGGAQLAAVGGGYWGSYGFPYFAAVSPFGGYAYYPGMMLGLGGFGYYPYGGMYPPPMPMRGPAVVAPPREALERWGRGAKPQVAVPSDAATATQQMVVGDRLFRAGNLKKAEERYQKANRAAADLAAPFVRLAQVALVRGNYAAAAARLRDAETAQPGWIETANDIQSIYGEPAEFARQIARLESHVQVHPNDRDAWLILGAQWFLSGRTERAADVFLRLNDPNRKADIALNAFLDASSQVKLRPDEEAEPDE
ncbi:MAG: tetratricopeptide repeat protein [Isosphaeraceae bacterium]